MTLKIPFFQHFLSLWIQVASSTYHADVNTYGVKCGGSLEMWESSGWINKQDPYGWFQWYCRWVTAVNRYGSQAVRQNVVYPTVCVKSWCAWCFDPSRRFFRGWMTSPTFCLIYYFILPYIIIYYQILYCQPINYQILIYYQIVH